MRNALRTALAVTVLTAGMAVLGVCIVFDYFTDPRPYPMGRKRKEAA